MPSPEFVAVIVSTLSTYLAFAGESFAKEIGTAAANKVTELYQAVKDRFVKEKKNKDAAKTLKQFEKNPKEWAGPMKSALTDIMTKDPEFSTLLEKLIKESEAAARKAGTENNFQTMVTGGSVGKIVDIGTVNGDVHF